MKINRREAFVGVLILVLSGVARAESAEDAWKKAFKDCGKSELSGKHVNFFGTSNTVGIGSVWRKSDSGYNLRFDLPKLVPDAALRTTLVAPGTAPSECSGTHTGGLALALTLPFLQTFSGLTGFSASWNSASNTKVTVDKITFDQLSEADYENLLSQMGTSDPTNFYYRDTTEKNRLVMNKAFRVSGVTVTADYTPDQLKDLKGKYPNGGSVNVGGDKGATITFGYSSVSSLTLKASGEIYIAGEFAKLQGGHVALAGNANAVKYKMIPVDARNVVIGTPDDAHP